MKPILNKTVPVIGYNTHQGRLIFSPLGESIRIDGVEIVQWWMNIGLIIRDVIIYEKDIK